MSNEKAKELINKVNEDYTDLVGIVCKDFQPTPESTKNGLTQTGLFLSFINELDEGMEPVEKFYDLVKSCEVVPGVYARYPEYTTDGKIVPRNTDADSYDDTRGVIAGSKSCSLKFQEDVLDYGLKHFFIYNNQKPGKFDFFAVRIYKYVDILWYFIINKKLTLLSSLLMLILKLRQETKNVTYITFLDYMVVHSLSIGNNNWKEFKKEYMKKCKLVESTAGYFGDDHPMTELAKEVKKLYD